MNQLFVKDFPKIGICNGFATQIQTFEIKKTVTFDNMKIRKIRIRLSKAWAKVTFATASLLLSVISHAQQRSDTVRSRLPEPEPIALRSDSIKPQPIDTAKLKDVGIISVDKALAGRPVMYGAYMIIYDKYEPLPGSTTIDETLQGTDGNHYFNKRR